MLRLGDLRARFRLARHLWRMCFALFIAAGSLFSIRERVAKILPEPFTTPTVRALPVVFVFAAMLDWLWRVRTRRMPCRHFLVTAVDAVPLRQPVVVVSSGQRPFGHHASDIPGGSRYRDPHSLSLAPIETANNAYN